MILARSPPLKITGLSSPVWPKDELGDDITANASASRR
jgi:hypothetical protein